ncbi:MAG: maltokinase N-terminal cap-like domain-containing protein [Candidatus Dormibacteria bacterium]
MTELAAPAMIRERVEQALPAWLPQQRWFAADGEVRGVVCEEMSVVSLDPEVTFAVFAVDHGGSQPHRYCIPLAVTRPHALRPTDPGAIVIEDESLLIFDALADAQTAAPFWRLVAAGGEAQLRGGRLLGQSHGLDEATADISPLVREQSNTSLVVANHHLIKVIRTVAFQPSVELEMVRALGGAGFDSVAAIEGWLDYERDGEEHRALTALVQRFIHNGTDGWKLALTSLRDLYADAEEDMAPGTVERVQTVENQGSSFTFEAARLGEVTARMHLALSTATGEGMRARPIDADTLDSWATAIDAELTTLLGSEHGAMPELAARAAALRARVASIRDLDAPGLAIRVHGDYHLGQVLRTDAGWVILDFEGEPLRDVSERRSLQSPMRDVAGMLRSFDYAAAVALTERGVAPGSAEWRTLSPYGRTWSALNRDAFWAAYLEHAAATVLLPNAGCQLALRRAFEIGKAVYEVAYERAHRPSWTAIPLAFLLEAT